MFKEVSLQEIVDYKDPFSLYEDSAIALAKDPSLGEDGRRAAITIAWGGLGILFNDPVATVYIHKTRFSEQVFAHANSFSVCFFDQEHQNEIDRFYGAKSGRDIDKFHGGVFTPDHIDDVPIFKEAKLVLICEKAAEAKIDAEHVFHHDRHKVWYEKEGGHTLFIGKIMKVLRQ